MSNINETKIAELTAENERLELKFQDLQKTHEINVRYLSREFDETKAELEEELVKFLRQIKQLERLIKEEGIALLDMNRALDVSEEGVRELEAALALERRSSEEKVKKLLAKLEK